MTAPQISSETATPVVTSQANLSTGVYSKDLPNLDILRSFAVLCVFGSHLLQFFFGFIPILYPISRAGVLMFFVHTSLVLLMAMERSGKRGWALFKNFYIRRLFRIYPLSVVIVLSLAFTRIPDLPWGSYSWIGWPAVWNDLFLVSNLAHTPDITSPLWSLPYEVQMYIALPALFLLLARIRQPTIIWLASVVLSLAAGFAWTGITGRQAALVSFFPSFVGGLIAFKRGSDRFGSKLWPLAILVWVGCFCVVAPKSQGPQDVAGWFACPVLAAAIPMFQQTTNRWVRSAATLVAKYSYGIYLTHMPLIWICFVWLHGARSAQWLCFTILIVGLPAFLFHAVEHPLVRFGARLAKN